MLKRMLAVSALFLGLGFANSCGGDDDQGLAGFVGTWRYTSGTLTVKCGDNPPSTEQASGILTIAKGIDSDLVMSDEDCDFKFKVIGQTAQLSDSSQTCIFPNDFGGSTTLKYNAHTVTVNGITASESGNGILTSTSSAGGSITCTFTGTAGLQKSST